MIVSVSDVGRKVNSSRSPATIPTEPTKTARHTAIVAYRYFISLVSSLAYAGTTRSRITSSRHCS